MSELPKGWVACTPSELANDPKNEIVDGPFGSNLKASEYTDEGTPIVRIQNVKRMAFLDKNIKYVTDEKAEFLKRHSFKSGDLLITKLGEPLGLTCIAPDHLNEGIIVADIVRFRPTPEVNRKCLAYLLNSEGVIKQINAHTKGSTRARINLSVIRNLNINLPPLAEQKRIVEKLDEVLAQVDTIKARLDGIPDLLKRFRQSVLASAVSGKLTEAWRAANPFFDWQTLTIGDVSTVATGKTPKRTNSDYWNSEDVPWLTSSATGNLYCYEAEQFVSHFGAEDCKLKRFPVGTLLLAMYGEGKTRGQVTELMFEATCNQACAAIVVDEAKALKSYVKLRLLENYEETRKAAAGGNQPNLNLNKVREIGIQLPSIEEQKEIVRLVDQYFAFADTIEAQVKKAQARVDNLTQSILAKAFRGELVAQDPADEPADKLLARIAQARAEAEALAKAAKKAESIKKRAAKKATQG